MKIGLCVKKVVLAQGCFRPCFILLLGWNCCILHCLLHLHLCAHVRPYPGHDTEWNSIVDPFPIPISILINLWFRIIKDMNIIMWWHLRVSHLSILSPWQLWPCARDQKIYIHMHTVYVSGSLVCCSHAMPIRELEDKAMRHTKQSAMN